MNLYYLGRALTFIYTRILFKIQYEGVQNIPKDSGFILACNHRSNYDCLLLAHKVPKQIHYLGKVELFRNRFLKWIMQGLGVIPIDRGSGETASMETAAELLNDGQVIGIFPEGHRSKSPTPLRVRNGIGKMALETKADVLPCAVIYGEKLNFRSTIIVKFGEIIKNSELGNGDEESSKIRVTSKQIMQSIICLIDNQPNVDERL